MRVLIVDDEVVIREGLRTLIDWRAAGFEKVLDAKNALEAMDKIEQAMPDLILTDIFMPEMSGLEFAKIIREKYPLIRFVILTGYEKFEYAKQAIEIGVAKYLVKPILPDELKETVEEIRDEMTLENRNRNWSETARQRLNEYKPIITEKFWGDLLAGAITKPEEIRERAEAADVGILYPHLHCLSFEISDLEKVYKRYGVRELSLVRFAIRNIVEEIHMDKILYIYDHSDTVLLCVVCQPVETEEWKKTVKAIEDTLKIDVRVGIGKPSDDISSVRQSSIESLDSVKYLAMLDQTGLILYEEIPAWKKDHVEYPYEEEKMLLETLRYKDQINVQVMEPFIRKIRNQNPSPQMIQLTCVQLLGSVYRLADEYGINSIPSFNKSVSRLEPIPSYSQIQQLFVSLFQEIINRKSSHHASFVSQLVDRAKQMIHNRFSDPSLSVSLIAQTLSISPNYLSRIFHQQTGVTCVEFITDCRLEEAKKLLLLTAHKNYEVAEKVGYANAHYFSFMFKKNIGCSPSEFRDREESGQS